MLRFRRRCGTGPSCPTSQSRTNRSRERVAARARTARRPPHRGSRRLVQRLTAENTSTSARCSTAWLSRHTRIQGPDGTPTEGGRIGRIVAEPAIPGLEAGWGLSVPWGPGYQRAHGAGGGPADRRPRQPGRGRAAHPHPDEFSGVPTRSSGGLGAGTKVAVQPAEALRDRGPRPSSHVQVGSRARPPAVARPGRTDAVLLQGLGQGTRSASRRPAGGHRGLPLQPRTDPHWQRQNGAAGWPAATAHLAGRRLQDCSWPRPWSSTASCPAGACPPAGGRALDPLDVG